MAPKQVLARRTPQVRKKERKELGSLQSLVVAPRTQERYFQAVSLFLDFLVLHVYPYPTTFLSLDGRVREYIEYLWQNGDSKALASDCLSGLGHYIPQCKRHLAGAWRLHGSWSRAELPARALPFTPMIVYALAQRAYDHGWSDMAVLLLLGFDRFARTGELFNAKRGDFHFDTSLRRVVWTLPLTKSGQRHGAQESLVVDDVWLVHALYNFMRFHAPGDLLRAVSPGAMRHRLKQLFVDLQLPEGFQWYSLRRGGATHAFRLSNNLPALCVVGRWNCPKTARIYLADALAQLTELSLTAAVRTRLLRLARTARPSWSCDT